MDNEFYTLLTDRGMAKIASALADKKQLHLQKMAVGDGGGLNDSFMDIGGLNPIIKLNMRA